jgi:hypothetical protein
MSRLSHLPKHVREQYQDRDARIQQGVRDGLRAQRPHMEVEFSDVISSGTHVHCYLDRYYVARLTQERDRWDIEICNRPCGSAPTRAEAEEVVRMWAARQEIPLRNP